MLKSLNSFESRLKSSTSGKASNDVSFPLRRTWSFNPFANVAADGRALVAAQLIEVFKPTGVHKAVVNKSAGVKAVREDRVESAQR